MMSWNCLFAVSILLVLFICNVNAGGLRSSAVSEANCDFAGCVFCRNDCKSTAGADNGSYTA